MYFLKSVQIYSYMNFCVFVCPLPVNTFALLKIPKKVKKSKTVWQIQIKIFGNKHTLNKTYYEN